MYRGYAALVASRGAVGVTLDHDLFDADAYPRAAGQVMAAVGRVLSHLTA